MATWLYSNTPTWGDWDFMDNNAQVVYDFLTPLGWSVNAISALCGNLRLESGINPWSVGTGGGGLAGWTPLDNLISWALRNGYNYKEGPAQITLISTGYACGGGATGRPEDGLQWGKNTYDPHAPSVDPPVSWEEFKVSELPPATLASYYMYYWERPNSDPTVNQIQERMDAAEHFYTLLTGREPEPPEPPTPEFNRFLLFGIARDMIRRLILLC